MCLLVLAWRVHPRYSLVVAANRDEFHERPAAALAKWPAPAAILAGRDLRANGTWLALDRGRRFGVVTNFRELQRPRPAAPSRGELIPAYLRSPAGPQEYFGALQGKAAEYSAFNLLLADQTSLWYGSNRGMPFARALDPGIYGLSNESLDTPWPKLRRVRRGFEDWLHDAPAGEPERLFALLGDRTRVGDDAELDALTPREREVLQLIARGYRYKEIAARLHLSVKTVEAHVSSVLRKLQLSSRHELTRWAQQRRLI